jgi:hypothetical protein
MRRDFAETGNPAASNVPTANETMHVRRDIMVWPFPVPIALCENSADEREFLTRPGEDEDNDIKSCHQDRAQRLLCGLKYLEMLHSAGNHGLHGDALVCRCHGHGAAQGQHPLAHSD